jgi:hypothetical protein
MKKMMMAALVSALAAGGLCAAENWIQLFNGKDLQNWTPKIRGYPSGENFGDTFRVEDGMIKVRYDKGYDGAFKNRFGHLFYNRPFSNYVLRVEYRFVGEQLPDGPGWAKRNSGMMLHGQSPESMALNQDFPVSIEYQLLGGFGTGKRTTANLCTPGTNVEMNDKLFTQHCVNSSSETYHGEEWVTVEVEARGEKYFKHIIDGKTVLEYQAPQYDPKSGDAKPLIEANGGSLLIKGGTISLQSESAPCDFRKIEIRLLD